MSELETFDINGEPQPYGDKRATMVYRVDYDIAVELLAWAYNKLSIYSHSKMETALKLDEIKLLLLEHRSYLSFKNEAAGEQK